MSDDLRRSLLNADPRLSRFDPLSRIIYYDDFDNGINGWSELIGNYKTRWDQSCPNTGTCVRRSSAT